MVIRAKGRDSAISVSERNPFNARAALVGSNENRHSGMIAKTAQAENVKRTLLPDAIEAFTASTLTILRENLAAKLLDDDERLDCELESTLPELLDERLEVELLELLLDDWLLTLLVLDDDLLLVDDVLLEDELDESELVDDELERDDKLDALLNDENDDGDELDDDDFDDELEDVLLLLPML